MPKRHRGSRTAPRRPRAVRHERFDVLVDRVIAGIPMPFRAALDDVALVIADEPSPELLRDLGMEPDEALYGLWEPAQDGTYDGIVSPPRILIFRLPLEEDFPDPVDLAHEVRQTIVHELAHRMGIDDEHRLAELGID